MIKSSVDFIKRSLRPLLEGPLCELVRGTDRTSMRSIGTKVAGSGGDQSKGALDNEGMDFFNVGTGGIAPVGTGPDPADIDVAVVAFVLREKEDCPERCVSFENTLSRLEPLAVVSELLVLLLGIGGR